MGGMGVWGRRVGVTQGALAALVADTTPARLRGTAFGVFNLVGGAAMLVASVLAGWLWDHYGPPATFYAGAAFTVAALAGLWKALTGGRRGGSAGGQPGAHGVGRWRPAPPERVAPSGC